jgi:hypothetical protein
MAHYGTAQSPTALVAPEIRLLISAPSNTAFPLAIPAIADTGAATTCIPQWALKQLEPYGLEYRWGTVRGPVGPPTPMRIYSVNLKMLECEYEDHEVGIIERNCALIGRDILNRYNITFDGPNENWTISKK